MKKVIAYILILTGTIYILAPTGNLRLIGFGNPFITLASFKDTTDKVKLWGEIEKIPCSNFSNSGFNLDGIDESISYINVLLLEKYQDLLFGMSNNIDMDLEQLRVDANALGLEKAVMKFAEQLEKNE